MLYIKQLPVMTIVELKCIKYQQTTYNQWQNVIPIKTNQNLMLQSYKK